MKTTPVPVSRTICGLPPALSEIIRPAVAVPATAGLNVTAMVQLAPAFTVLPQVFVWEKGPLMIMPEIVSVAVPVLLSVTVCTLLVPTI